jgi:hypothetical protein
MKSWRQFNFVCWFVWRYFLVPLYVFGFQAFIKQNDDRSSEHIPIDQNYTNLSEMKSVAANIVFSTFSCIHSVCLQLPMHSVLKYVLLEVLEDMVLKF